MEIGWWILTISFLGLTASILWNLHRQKQIWQGQLKPNCLLTRYPLVFVPGPRSIFFFKKYYFKAPSYLAEHGYDVFELHLPWKKNRRDALTRALESFQKNHKQIHLVLHPQIEIEFSDILKKYPHVILSVTHYKTETTRKSYQHLSKLHNLMTPYTVEIEELGAGKNDFDCLIDKVQKIAEDDFIRGTP